MVAPEVKELRLQVDSLKQQLEFIQGSLFKFTQDYFQHVECEASVQLMRLKNAKIGSEVSADGSPSEPTAQGAVETAKWLHIMTDIVMGLHLGSSGASSAASTATPAPQASPALPQRSPGAPARYPPRGGQQFSPRGAPPSAAAASLLEALAAPQLPSQPPVSPLPGTLASGPAPTSSGFPPLPVGGCAPASGALLPSTMGHAGLSASATPLGGSCSSGAAGEAAGRRSWERGAAPVPAAGSTASPRLGGTSPLLGPQRMAQVDSLAGGSTLENGGLLLGRGMWANAYRQASGVRREALTLLCENGIVTERELADDLTVISEEHIEECISIAMEMLQRWPRQHGPAPQREAKAFFEERLADLYLRRPPAPFGAH